MVEEALDAVISRGSGLISPRGTRAVELSMAPDERCLHLQVEIRQALSDGLHDLRTNVVVGRLDLLHQYWFAVQHPKIKGASLRVEIHAAGSIATALQVATSSPLDCRIAPHTKKIGWKEGALGSGRADHGGVGAQMVGGQHASYRTVPELFRFERHR